MKKISIQSLVLGIAIGATLMLSFGSFAEEFFQFKKSTNTVYFNGIKKDIDLYNYNYTNFGSIREIANAFNLDINVVDTNIYFTNKPTESTSKTLPQASQTLKIPETPEIKYTPDGIKSIYDIETNQWYIWTGIATSKWADDSKLNNNNTQFRFILNFEPKEEYASSAKLVKIIKSVKQIPRKKIVEGKFVDDYTDCFELPEEETTILLDNINVYIIKGVEAITYDYYIENIYPIIN